LVDDILKKYPNDVRVVIKNFPLDSHKQANKAALYALASGRQGKYYEMYQRIFNKYKKLRNNEDYPITIAKELNLDINRLKNDIEDHELQRQIDLEVDQLKNTGMRMALNF
jgi:predicted DsbA family dithiol-disulfide isomerase